MAVGVSLVVVLLVCWGGHWTHEQDPLTASIVVTRTDVPGFTPQDDTQFRAASGRHTFTCMSSGGSGNGPTYQWSSTCNGCPFDDSTSDEVSRGAVASNDDGTHTCTVTRGGEEAMATTTINIVGAGIHLFDGTSDPASPGAQVSVANNALVIARAASFNFRLRIFCRSDAMMESSSRQIIGLDGNNIETAGPFLIERLNPGEITIVNTPSQSAMTSNEQGVYTCRIQLQSGEIRDVNIGIYPDGFSTPPTAPTITSLTMGPSPSTLNCISTGSPATTVTFRRGSTSIGPLRDGESETDSGVTYTLTQAVTNRALSTYENVLTISSLSAVVGDMFRCRVTNTLGTSADSDPLTIEATVQIDGSTSLTVGESATFTCTSLLGAAADMIQWFLVDGASETQQVMNTGQEALDLVLNSVSQSMDGNTYRCRVTNGGDAMDGDVTISVQVPLVTLTTSQSPGTPVVGASYTLTCTVSGADNLGGANIVWAGPRTNTGTGTSSLQLSFGTLVLSDAGVYTCTATISNSDLLNNDITPTSSTETITLQIPPPSVSITHDGGATLYAGSVLTLTCEVTLRDVPVALQPGLTVNTTLLGTGGNPLSTAGRITVSGQQSSGTTYTRTAVINTLFTGNNGTYACEADLLHTSQFITDRDDARGQVPVINIQVPTLTLSVMPNATRLPNAEPYNQFTITCIATAPEGVISPKTFIWRRTNVAGGSCDSFTEEISDDGATLRIIFSSLGQPVSTSVLTVTEDTPAEWQYCCEARLIGTNLGSSDVIENDALSVDVTGPADPVAPVNLRNESISATSSRIRWTVPIIAYTPEMYVVMYSTGALTRQVMMSDPQSSGTDFETRNQEFSVVLTGLTVGTTYNYRVDSTNSRATTSSGSRSFVFAEPDSGGGSSSAGAIAGGIIAAIIVIVLVIVVVVLIYYIRRRRGDSVKSSYVPAPAARETTAITAGRDPIRYTKPAEEINMEKIIAPVIQEFPESDLTFMEGEGLHFAIHVTGVPTPSTVWYLDGKELISDYSMDVAGDGSLTIPSVEPRHSGTYKLVVTNQGGSMDRTVMVSVLPEDEATPSVAQRQQLDVRPISVPEFGKYVATNHSNNNQGFRDLYAALDTGADHPVTVATTPKNKPLNRFANITVYDDNRIMLQSLPGHSDCQRDYINACYVDGYSIPNKFIATQGPLPKTNVDFWRLVWQERPPSIVMVTNLREGNKIKCQQYWPESGNKKFGPFQITITDQQTFADYNIRTFRVSLSGSSERPLKVTQFHFTAWPDHGVPEYATPILSFHRRIVAHHVPSRGPLLVHCSAGVGRTGTFITINSVLEQIQKEQVIDIFGNIDKIRKQRMKLVQTVEQYIFIHDAVLESITCGDTQIAATDFRFAMRKLEGRDPQTRQTGFESQFKVLHQVSPKPGEVRRDAALRHREDNRSLDYLPSDQHRVVLKGEVPDYIHAVSANGYKQQKAFIIAENPMQHTCRNFWKMLYSRKCAAIIMLSQLSENGKEVCFQYWPTSGVKQFGEFTVDLLGEEKLEGFILRTLSVLDTKSGKAQQITQFHIVNWSPDGYCSNLKTVTDIIEEVSKVQRKTGNHPIAIHCSDTVCRSGMFCSIATTIERCKTEGVVDVFQVLKALRVQKPGAVLTVVQYQHVFEAILVFLDSFDTYANFQNI